MSVFFLRAVCHDNPDPDVVKILSLLRAAATPSTALVIGDSIMGHTCEDNKISPDITGAQRRLGPAPLLANLGKASANASYMDLTVRRLLYRAFQPSL